MTRRILHVTHHFLPRHRAGVEVYTDRVARGLAATGHEVAVLTTDDDPSRRPHGVRDRDVDGLRLFEIADPHLVRAPEDTFGHPAVLEAFDRCVEEFAPDLVHFQHVMFVGLDAPLRVRARGLASVMTLHEYWLLCARHGQMRKADGTNCPTVVPETCAACLRDFRFGRSRTEVRLRRWSRWVERLSGFDPLPRLKKLRRGGRSRNPVSGPGLHPDSDARILDFLTARRAAVDALIGAVDHFLAPSRFLRQMFIDCGWPADRITHSPYGTIALGEPTNAPRGAGPLRVGFMGSIIPQKGAHVLVEAHGHVTPGKITVDIHGDPTVDPSYGEELGRRTATGEVRLRGPFAPDGLEAVLRELDVLVVPSLWYENAPLVISEAFACGIPVVTSKLGGMAEMVRDDIDGRLFDPGDARQLAGILEGLADDRAALLRLREGVRAPRSVEDDVQSLQRLYEGLLT